MSQESGGGSQMGIEGLLKLQQDLLQLQQDLLKVQLGLLKKMRAEGEAPSTKSGGGGQMGGDN